VRGSCTEICTEIPCGTSVPCDLCCRSETISTVCGSFHRTISGISILSPAIGKYGHAVSSLRYFPYTFFFIFGSYIRRRNNNIHVCSESFFFFFCWCLVMLSELQSPGTGSALPRPGSQRPPRTLQPSSPSTG
jgi:hypothetical protein